METTTKTVKFLRLTFSTSLNRERSLQIPYPKSTLTKTEIMTAMTAIRQTGAILFPDGEMLSAPKSAEVIERVTTTSDFEIEA